jgi:2-haloacid dehalogenase
MRMVKAYLFDVFGTLVDWRSSLIAFFERFGAERNLRADWPALVDAWRAAYAPSMERVRRGELPWSSLDALHRASFDDLAPRFGLQQLDETERATCVLAWHRLEPWPDTLAGLAALRARAIVGSLSNGNVALQVDLVRHTGMRFDVLFSAEHFRHYKPDFEVYRGAVALLGLEPHDVTLVAAHNSDLQAARECGLSTAFVARPREHGPHQTRDLAPDPEIERAARDLLELAEQAGA